MARCSGVVLRSGEEIAADFVVLAVPFDRVLGLIPESHPRSVAGSRPSRCVARSPDHRNPFLVRQAGLPVRPRGHSGPVDPVGLQSYGHSRSNRASGRGRCLRTSPATDPRAASKQGQYLQLVISASYDLLALDKVAIRDAVLADLAAIWPAARAARLLRWWVVTEHGATFAVRPGVERLRPPQRTPIDGLFLAGDWTDTGWPATMEGAVRSGYLAAQGILSVLDRPTRLIRPGLKPGLLAGWLFGSGEYVPAPASLFQNRVALADPSIHGGPDWGCLSGSGRADDNRRNATRMPVHLYEKMDARTHSIATI